MSARKIEPEQEAWTQYLRRHTGLDRHTILSAHDAFKGGWAAAIQEKKEDDNARERQDPG